MIIRAPLNPAAVQLALADLGLYSGDIDGKWGPLSRDGWRKLIEGYARCHPAPPVRLMPSGWAWVQAEGALYRDGKRVAVGYSGRGEGRNNPALQHVRATGPIPAGRYRIGAPRTSARTGPFVLDLTPSGHDALGRTAFQIHGDNARGDASSGCIVLPRAVRETIAASGLREIGVVA